VTGFEQCFEVNSSWSRLNIRLSQPSSLPGRRWKKKNLLPPPGIHRDFLALSLVP
jgi:hypothetical protein